MNGRAVFWFSVHLTLTVGAYFIPFLFDWPLVVSAYSVVLLQFLFFGRCLMNDGHDLSENEDETFYSDLLERLGFKPNRKKLRRFVRGYLYVLLMAFTLLWQVLWEHEPWLPLLP
ncbi:hypothetical protein HZ996_08295 [Cryomorphaceae bacterium]|nr:hypothetical protein HZ996_08295 [Cryomorphaceae bacterium]